MPTNYYEQTTPYSNFRGSKYKKYTIDDDDLIRFDDDDDVANQKDVITSDDDDGVPSRYDDFDEDFGTPGDFIEAFNPNVQVSIFIYFTLNQN